jgi:hypothetical protein
MGGRKDAHRRSEAVGGASARTTTMEGTVGGISSDDVEAVYPVLVCLDNTLVSPYIPVFLDEEFRHHFRKQKFRHTVTPVFTLGVEDIENLLGALQSIPLSEILQSYHFANKNKLTSLSHSSVPLIRKMKPGRNLVRDYFLKFGDRLEQDLFGPDASTALHGNEPDRR